MKKRIIAIVLTLFWMGFIFYNSSQNGDKSNNKSYEITNEIKNSIKSDENSVKDNNKVTSDINGNSSVEKSNIDKERSAGIISENMQKFHVLIRKSAHAFEYFILAILVLLTLSTFGTSIRENVILVLFIVLLYAVGDEYHQLFVEGRSSSVVDVIIDFTGGIIGLLTYYIGTLINKIFKEKKALNLLKNQIQ